MGSCRSRVDRSRVSGSNFQANILMLGLNSSGKTTILNKLKLNKITATTSTIGFNVESVDTKAGNFTVWDVGGLFYVVDSVDAERLPDARYELHRVLEFDEMLDVPLVVLANKQDMPGAVSVSDMTDQLGLHALKDRQWDIQATRAKSGDGLLEGMKMMSTFLKAPRIPSEV